MMPTKCLVLFVAWMAGVSAHGQVATVAGPDIQGEALLALPGDPTFDTVAAIYPPMKMSRELLGVPDAPKVFAVSMDSTIEFEGGQWFLLVGQTPTRFAVNTNGVSFDLDTPTSWWTPGADHATGLNLVKQGITFGQKSLWKGYLPVVITHFDYEGLRYEQMAYGFSQEMSEDAPLYAFVRLTITNPGNQPQTATIEPRVREGSAPVKRLDRQAVALQPGETGRVYFRLPQSQVADGFKEIDAQEYDRNLVDVEAYWSARLNTGMRIHTPEVRVNNAYKTWMAYNFLNVCKRDGIYQPFDGRGVYALVYGYSAGRYCHALDQMGHSSASRRYLASLLTLVGQNKEKDDRLFIQNFGLPDHGVLLWALSEHYRYTRDVEWLKSVAPTMVRMCDWIVEARVKHKSSQSPDDRWYGMLLYWPYCDEPTPAYSYLSDVWLTVGMEHAAAVIAEAGMTAESERIATQAAGYRQDLENSMKRSVIVRDGVRILPMFPQTHALLERVDFTARDYYTLVAGMLLESQFLAPRAELTDTIIEFLRGHGGLYMGMCRFLTGIDHAYTYGYWQTYLFRGEPEPLILGFYGSLAYGMSQTTYAACETAWLVEGTNYYHLPHLYSNTQQLKMLRDMLVLEQGGELWLGSAIPRPWLAVGSGVDVANAPTRWGTISYSIDTSASPKRLVVNLELPVDRQLPTVRIYLRHPDGQPIKDMKIMGRATGRVVNESIELTDLRDRKLQIDVSY